MTTPDHTIEARKNAFILCEQETLTYVNTTYPYNHRMNTFQTSDNPLTVEELLHFLQELLKTDPSLLKATISHSEMGEITHSHTMYLTIEGYNKHPIVVFSGPV